MDYKLKSFPFLSAVVLVNAAGILLRYYDFDPYFILLGFRFHISFFLPLIIVFRKDKLSILKKIFTAPEFKYNLLPAAWILIPGIIISSVLYFVFETKISEPEYFYELGLSSIVDYPVYLAWNLPQLFMLFCFLKLSSALSRLKFINVFFTIILIFAFEFIPLKESEFNILSLMPLLLSALAAGLMIAKFSNIYWFAVTFFTAFWMNILAAGSSSKTIINILFAKQYESWEGFFVFPAAYSEFILPAYLLLVFLMMIISLPLIKAKNIENNFAQSD